MATNKLQWKRIAKGDRLPCDSLLMKKDGTIPSVVSGAGVKVGQEAYYLSVEELKSFPKEESENEKTKRLLHTIAYKIGQHLRDIFTEEEYQCYDAWSNAWLEKKGEQKHQYNSRPRYIGEEELFGEQKPADKVETKFKVGDKIYLKPEYRMPKDDTPIANTVFEIRRIDDKYYRFDRSYIFIEDQDKYELVEQKSANWYQELEDKLANATPPTTC